MENFVPATQPSIIGVSSTPDPGPAGSLIKGDWASAAGQIGFIPDALGNVVGVTYVHVQTYATLLSPPKKKITAFLQVQKGDAEIATAPLLQWCNLKDGVALDINGAHPTLANCRHFIHA